MAPLEGGGMRKFFFIARVTDELEGKCRDGGDDNQCDDEHDLSPLLGLAVKFLEKTA